MVRWYKDKQTPETEIKQQIKKYLKISGFFYYSNLQGLGCTPGISDIVAIKEGIVLFIEVKAGRGVQSDNQKDFERAIRDHSGNYMLAYSAEDVDNYLKMNFPQLKVITLF
jgi:hypothetical protein